MLDSEAMQSQFGNEENPLIAQFLNASLAHLGSGEIYLQVGCKAGEYLIGALLNHPEVLAYAVVSPTVADPTITPTRVEQLASNLTAAGLDDRVFCCPQPWEEFFCDLQAIAPDEKVGVYFYNGALDYRSVLLGLTLASPFLGDHALIIVNQGQRPQAQQAIADFLLIHLQAQMLADPTLTAGVGSPPILKVLTWDKTTDQARSWDELQSHQLPGVIDALRQFHDHDLQEQMQVMWSKVKQAQQAGDLVKAVELLSALLEWDAEQAEAWQDLSVAHYSLGQNSAAYQAIQRAIAIQPEIGRYYHVSGVILEALKQGAEAIQAHETAIRLDPSLANSYNNLGLLYVANRRYEDAEAVYQQAIQACPDHYWAYVNLYDLFKSCDLISEALAIANQGIQRFPENIALKHAKYLILPTLYRSEAEIQDYRAAFQTGLTQFVAEIPLDTEIQRRQTWFDIGRCHNFLLTYQGKNDRELQQQYGELVHRVVAANYPEWVQPRAMPPLGEGERIRVGYVSHCFHTHSVGKLTLGWFRHASHDRFELYCYHQGITQDGITQAFQAFSDHYYYLQDPEAVCRQILADRLHILVFTDLGMHPATTVIAAARLAPVQCVFWGHPVTTGLPTIDYFLSSALMEPENGQDHYTETLVPLPNLGIVYEWPQLPAQTQSRLAFLSPYDTGKIVTEASILYLSCQSLFKYLPQYDYIFATIAQQVPNARFLFLSWLPPAITDKFQQRLELAFSQVGLRAEDFCLILPSLHKDDYLNLNQISDVYLDALAWSGGNTTFDAIACGLPIVTCPGEFMRGRHTYGILRMLGVMETIAENEQTYTEIAVRMGLDSGWREQVAQAICKNRYKLQSDPVCIQALEAFYTQMVNKSMVD